MHVDRTFIALALSFAGALAVVGAAGNGGERGGTEGSALPTAFTYQGSITKLGDVVNGSFSAVFRLFDTPTGGTALASDSVILDVVDSLFTVEVNFGESVFTGEDRYLEIEFSTQVFSPRQLILPTPYAMMANSVAEVGQSAVTVLGTDDLVTPATGFLNLIPGLTQTVNVPAGAIVHVSTEGGFFTNGPDAQHSTQLEFALVVDGIPVTGGRCGATSFNLTDFVTVPARWDLERVLSLAPGSHTIEVEVRLVLGFTGTVSGVGNDPNRGQLTVMILKQ